MICLKPQVSEPSNHFICLFLCGGGGNYLKLNYDNYNDYEQSIVFIHMETRIILQHKNLNKSVNCFMTVL